MGTRIAAPDDLQVRELRSAPPWPSVPARSTTDPSLGPHGVIGPSDPVRKRRAAPSIGANRLSWGRSAAAGSIWGYVSDCYSETESVAKREPHMRPPLRTLDQDDSLVIDRKAKRG
jgi:hypothetical protein